MPAPILRRWICPRCALVVEATGSAVAHRCDATGGRTIDLTLAPTTDTQEKTR